MNQSAQDEQPLQEQQSNWARDHEATQLHCLLKMIVHNIGCGVKKTQLHMMLGHALYARDRSKSLFTAFNRIGSCTSYQTIHPPVVSWLRHDLLSRWRNIHHMPSTFTRDDYIMAAMHMMSCMSSWTLRKEKGHCTDWRDRDTKRERTCNRSE